MGEPSEEIFSKFINPNRIELKSEKKSLEEKHISFNLFSETKKISLNPNYFSSKEVHLNFNQKFLKQVAFPKGLMFEAREEITPENIGEFALPIVQFIHQTQPDFVLACDRGARLFGLAVMMLYQELYGEFPTKDHRMHFRRITKSVPPAETLQYLRPDAEKMHETVPDPRILVLDDWVASGTTRQQAEMAFEGHMGTAKVFWGVMRGMGADVSGSSQSLALPAWKDNPEILGLDYDGTKVRRIKSSEAFAYRKRMANSIKAFAQKIKAQGDLQQTA